MFLSFLIHSYYHVYVLSDVDGGLTSKDNIANHILDKSVNISSVADVEAKNISRWYLIFMDFFAVLAIVAFV